MNALKLAKLFHVHYLVVLYKTIIVIGILFLFKLKCNKCMLFLDAITKIKELDNLRINRKWNRFYEWKRIKYQSSV